jgi:predicted Zn-ribbon and HTH transcriptional regulator
MKCKNCNGKGYVRNSYDDPSKQMVKCPACKDRNSEEGE